MGVASESVGGCAAGSVPDSRAVRVQATTDNAAAVVRPPTDTRATLRLRATARLLRDPHGDPQDGDGAHHPADHQHRDQPDEGADLTR